MRAFGCGEFASGAIEAYYSGYSMGLDLVELVIEVEKSFGISILNEDASKIITVGQLYEYVVANLPTEESSRCVSATAFLQFRRALIDQFGVNRREIRPSTLLGNVIPGAKRRSAWRVLARRLDWRCPPSFGLRG